MPEIDLGGGGLFVPPILRWVNAWVNSLSKRAYLGLKNVDQKL